MIEAGVGGGRKKRQWLSPEGPKGDKDRREAAADRQTCQSSQAKAGLSNGGETRKGGKDSRGVDESLYRHSTVSVASRVRQQKGGGKKIFLLLPFVSTPYPLFCLACECTLFSLFPRKKRRRGWGGEKLSPLPLNFFDAKISAKVEPFAPFLLLASLPPFFIPTTICEIRPLPPPPAEKGRRDCGRKGGSLCHPLFSSFFVRPEM